MEPWNSETYKGLLQQLQVGTFTLPLRQTLDELHRAFHALYEDYIVDTEHRKVTEEQFQDASRIYFQLGNAIDLQFVIGENPKDDGNQLSAMSENATSGSIASAAMVQDVRLKFGNQLPIADINSEQSKEKNMDVDPEPIKVPYTQFFSSMRPLLELPTYNAVNEAIIQDIMARCRMVKARVEQYKMLWKSEEKTVIAIVESKLDGQSRTMWNWDLGDSAQEPNFDGLMSFLTKRQSRINSDEQRSAVQVIPNRLGEEATSDSTCAYCRGTHKMCRCEFFKAMTKH